MQTKPTQAETILAKIISGVDRQTNILNNRDLSAVKILIRLKDGIVQDAEFSVDLKRQENRM